METSGCDACLRGGIDVSPKAYSVAGIRLKNLILVCRYQLNSLGVVAAIGDIASQGICELGEPGSSRQLDAKCPPRLQAHVCQLMFTICTACSTAQVLLQCFAAFQCQSSRIMAIWIGQTGAGSCSRLVKLGSAHWYPPRLLLAGSW